MSRRELNGLRRWSGLAAVVILLILVFVFVGSLATAQSPPTPSSDSEHPQSTLSVTDPKNAPWTGRLATEGVTGTRLNGEPDVRVSKWNLGGHASPGGVYVYAIYYGNHPDATETAADVTIVDTLPPLVTYAADTSGIVPQVGPGQVYTWNVGDLAPGEDGVFMVTVDVPADVPTGPGVIMENCASITSTTTINGDGDPSNDHACSDPLDVWNDEVELHVDKWANPGDPTPGQEFQYVINWCNNRGAAVGPVWLTDTLPAGVKLVDWEPQQWWQNLWIEQVATDEELALYAPGLPGNWCQELYVTLELEASVPLDTRLENTVVITAATDVFTGNNEYVHQDAQVSEPRYELYVDKWFNTGVLIPGGWVEYNLSYGNWGNMITPAWLTDTLPEETYYLPGNAWRYRDPFEPTMTTTQELIWNLGTISVAHGADIGLVLQISDTAASTITNCVEIAIPGAEMTPGNTESCSTVELYEPGPNLHVEKWSDWQREQIYYSIHFANYGDQAVSNVHITDTYPVSTTSGPWPDLPGNVVITATDNYTDGQWLFEIQELQPGQSGWIDLRVTVSDPDERPATYINTIQIDMPDGDANPADNSDTDTLVLGEVERVEIYFNHDGSSSGVWGNAEPGRNVTVTTPTGPFYAWADPACDGCWQIDQDTGPLGPGDQVTVEAGSGAWPVVIDIPNPFSAEADPQAGTVSGQIDGWFEQPVQVWGEWPGGGQDVWSDASGYYTATYQYMPQDARGETVIDTEVNYAEVRLHRGFRAPLVRIDANYDHDWVSVETWPNASVAVTLTHMGDLYTTAGQANGDGWFDSNEWSWDPEHPSIEPGDVVTASALGLTTTVDPIGALHGRLDYATDEVWGTVEAPWYDTVTVRCEVWEQDGPSIEVEDVAGDGGSFACDFGALPYDLQPGPSVMVRYIEPDGDSVIGQAAPQNLLMHVNYGHDWVEGNYEVGHTLWLTVTESDASTVKATAELQTQEIPWWGGGTGFSTNLDDPWVPERPDIQAGDYVYGRLSNGYMSTVRLGPITGILDLDEDSIAGNIYATWYGDTMLNANCGVWEDGGPGDNFQVNANGGSYACDFGDFGWDLQPGHDVGIEYQELDGDWVINMFSEPAPDMRVEKWPEGSDQFTPGGQVIFGIRYQNEGNATADTIVLTDTLPAGTSYVADSSGATPVDNGSELIWTLGPVDPGDQQQFLLVLDVDPGVTSDSLVNEVDIWVEYDSNPDNNHAEAEVYRREDGEPNLNISKHAEPSDPAPGQTFLYQIDYGNSGPLATGQVVLTDTLPDGTSIDSWYSENGYSLWTEESTADQFILRAPTLPGGWGDRIVLRLLLAEVDVGTQLTNTAEISSATSYAWFEDTNVWVSDPYWESHIDKNFGWGTLVPNGEFEYNLHIRNAGNMPTPTSLTDTLPDGVTFAYAGRWDGQTYIDFPPTDPNASVLEWDLGVMQPGQWYNIDLRVTIDPATAPGTVLTNCAQIAIDHDDWPLNNQDCAVESVREPGPNLRVSKDYRWDNEQRLHYEILIQNLGTTNLDDVTITDVLPANTSLVNWWKEFWEDVDFTQNGDQLTWTVSGLNTGWSSRIQMEVDLDGGIAGEQGLSFGNSVEAPIPGDVHPADNYDEVWAYTGPDLYVEKWLSGGTVTPGEIVTFTVEFGNQNRWPWGSDEEYGSHLTETLPEGMTFLTATMPWDPTQPWRPDLIDGDTVVWGWGPMGSDSWWRFDVVAQIDTGVADGTSLVNTVQVGGDSPNDVEPDYDNNSFDMPLTALSPEFEVSKVYQTLAEPGGLVTYTLAVKNTGSSAGTNVLLRDSLPAGLTYGGGDGAFDGTHVTWTLANIPPGGGTATAWFWATLPDEGTILNDKYRVVGSDQGIGSTAGSPVSFTIAQRRTFLPIIVKNH